MTDNSTTVLIVEDQEGLAEAYETVVGTKYETRVATSGAQALEEIDDAVDVVLLDRRMPGMAGDEVLAEFVERGVTAAVAMLTAVEPDVDIVEMPFDDYVTKPIDNDELLALVETLQKRSQHDEQIQRFFRLAAKKQALENANKEDSTEYDQLVGEMRALRTDIDAALDEVVGDADPRTDL
ncbi:response regulator transcription factor [Halovenus halobia]|uniref:response regulator transcription factor n=1 Tax=Halovenus halobia TaxID=3396622 RepID=UPI003F5651A5